MAHVISTPSGIGGAERVVLALCAGRPGWQHYVLNPFSNDPLDTDLRRALPEGRYEGKSGGRRSLHELPHLRSWLQRRLRALRPHVVHAHLYHASVLLATLRRPTGERRVLTHHHGSFLVSEGRRVEAALEPLVAQRYDVVVAVSHSVLHDLSTRLRVPSERAALIPNGWSGSPRPSAPAAFPLVVAIANLRREKGIDTLIRAFAGVRARVPDARLRVLGQGPLEPELRALLAELRLDDAVSLTGFVSDIWPDLAAATVFVQPSRFETLGLTVLEAMAAGLPVVASAVGGLPELVEHDVNGLLVPPGDAEALAAALVALLGDRQRRDRLAHAALERAASRTVRAMVDAYHDLYQDLVAGPQRRRDA